MSPPPFRILRRPSNQAIQLVNDNSQSIAPTKTLEQREADYAAARRRIMESESEDSATVPENSELAAANTTSNESEAVNKAVTSVDDKVKNPTTLIRQSHTAIPLMSIPTVALSIPPSLDQNPKINPRPLSSVKLSARSTNSACLPTCVASTPRQLLHHHSPNTLSSGSLLPGYSNIPPMFRNFSDNLITQASQKAVVDVMQQPQSSHPNVLKSDVPFNMTHQFQLLGNYRQTLSAATPNQSNAPFQYTSTNAQQPIFLRAAAACNQINNLVPSMQFRSAPLRFTYSSGYN